MKITIVGYGRMGHEIEMALIERGHQVFTTIDTHNEDAQHKQLSMDILKDSDGVIEFSLPDAVPANVELYTKAGVPCVIGTTGWDSKKSSLKKLITDEKGYLLYGSNFSPGAHMFFALAEKAAAMINNFSEYDIMMTEYHHKMKKDSPSGTALTAAKRILNVCDRKTEIAPDRIDGQIREEQLHVASVRGGSIPGIHEVLLDSPADSLSIRHTARGRMGFASGAVLALEWLQEKKNGNHPGFYSVDDFMSEFL